MLSAGPGSSPAETVAARRESLVALAELAADPVPPAVSCETLHLPAANDGAGLQIHRYSLPDAGPGALLYLHGGGWVAGDRRTHAGVCGALAEASGASVFALSYRRAPEHPFPGPIEDALAALDWLRREARALGVDPGRLGLAGDSAGANLAAAAAADRRAEGLALLLLLCPILDLTRTGGSRAAFGQGFFIDPDRFAADRADYLGGGDPADPRASPLLGPPPRARSVLVHAAACDPFRDEALDYAERCREAGLAVEAYVHPGMIHYFYALPRPLPYARRALAEMGPAIAAALER